MKIITILSIMLVCCTACDSASSRARSELAAYSLLGAMSLSATGSGSYTLMDVHGAGAQRSDPKSGNPADYPVGKGPQGDVLRIYNLAILVRGNSSASASYPVVDTGQDKCYDNEKEITCPGESGDFYGQDAQYNGLQPSYIDNGDGTVTDLNTGLMWRQDHGTKMTFDEAVDGAAAFDLAGYSDWRVPTIKELYSLIDFNGTDPNPMSKDTSGLVPFIDSIFPFEYGTATGERIIDAQYISSTKYVSTTMGGNETAFGVNLADGRIKGYPIGSVDGKTKTFYVKYVRGGAAYGQNSFTDNGDGTISDAATGLMWMKYDSGYFHGGGGGDGKLNWQQALAYAKDMEFAGYSDWRLPNAKELQSIVDYTRSPATTDSPAINSLFSLTTIIDEGGEDDYGYYWTGTTHISSSDMGNTTAVYIAFGKALGYMKTR